MHPFEILAEPVRRRIIEILASGEHLSGDVEAAITHEFGVGRSAVQHHLAVLRRDDWVIVRDEESMRGYRLNGEALDMARREVRHLHTLWKHRVGWPDGSDPLAPTPREWANYRSQSRRGRRGRGADPDDPWVRPACP